MRVDEHNLNSLREIVRKLQEENTKLKELLDENGISYEHTDILDDSSQPDDYDEDQGGRIIPLNPTIEMAKEFYSYFWGRTDVYAKRGKNGGYFPQCASRWDNPNCPKAKDEKKFCDEDCEYRGWKSLEPRVILKHLAGEKEDCTDVLGIYPLFPDNTCHFLVFDFDNHEKDAYKKDDANTDDLWKSEVDALRRICGENQIDALTERSRSGRGAHIWIFFKTAIPASLARTFGFALLDKGASSINLPSFKYYDRMYPSQDVLSKLGNLVALPLQGRALKNGNSAFIDESWNAYPNQWERLKSVRKLSTDDVTVFLQQWNEDQKNTASATKYAMGKGDVRPWKKDSNFHPEDAVGKELHLVLDDGVYVDTLNLMPRLQNQIKCLATIDNPEFYKNRAIGRSNYYNLRTISVWNESEGYIRIPIGLLESVQQKCKEAGIACVITDKRSHGRPIRVQFSGELRMQQSIAANQLEKYENGILCAPTAFGKTILAAYMVAKRRVSTLVLLEKTDLVRQWIEEFQRYLVVDEKPPEYTTPSGRRKVRESVIGTLVSGTDKTTGIIDFAMIGSAYHGGAYFENIDSYGMVLVDECHHMGSQQAQELMKRIHAKYIYGLTATPNRSDRLDDIVYMLLGPVRHKYTAKEQADEQGLERLMYPRFTRVVDISEEKTDIFKADNLIAESTVRNEQIVNDVVDAVNAGRTPVILTKLKRHAELLANLLKDKAEHVFLIYGGQTPKQNKKIKDEMLRTLRSESLILVATGQKIGEGFNFPRLDTLMLAAPIRFEGRLTQYVGRLNRVYEGKKDVVVYDYVDLHIPIFDRQYRSRLKTYKGLGYRVVSDVVSDKQRANAIYDGSNYMEVFERDLVEANSEIVISSPNLRQSKVNRFISLLKSRQEAGVKVYVSTMQPNEIGYEETMEMEFAINALRENGIKVRTIESTGERFAVIDRRLVWHGGMNLLGRAEDCDNLIRVESGKAAEELLCSSKAE